MQDSLNWHIFDISGSLISYQIMNNCIECKSSARILHKCLWHCFWTRYSYSFSDNL